MQLTQMFILKSSVFILKLLVLILINLITDELTFKIYIKVC